MYPVHVPISPLDTLIIPRALTSLNISNNNLGQCDLLPDEWQLMKDTGWEYELKDGKTLPDGNCGQDTPPPNSKSSGAIALANAISANGVTREISLECPLIHEGTAERYPKGMSHRR